MKQGNNVPYFGVRAYPMLLFTAPMYLKAGLNLFDRSPFGVSCKRRLCYEASFG